MTTSRLFIAIRIPETELAQWDQAQLKLKKEIKNREFEAKWTLPGNFHITLLFLGHVSNETLPKIESMISEVASKYPPFKLNINGMGAFADLLNAKIIFLGVQNKKILRSLQEELVSSLHIQQGRTYNFDAESNSMDSKNADFSPHLSILRFRKAHAAGDFISPFVRKKWGDVNVTELVLYQTELRGQFQVYTPIFTVPLSGVESE